jgi:hypothetical protein
MPFALSELELRPLQHQVLHIAIPGVVAAIWYRDRWIRAWLWLLAGWLIDLDHLFADPIYPPARCIIGFHPLHGLPAIFVYGTLGACRRKRLLGLGLLIHIGLDALDCLLIR